MQIFKDVDVVGILYGDDDNLDFVIHNTKGEYVQLAGFYKEIGSRKRHNVVLKTADSQDFNNLFNGSQYNEFDEFLSNPNSCKTLAISIMVKTMDGSVLLSKRSDKNKIGANLYNTTATGTVLSSDLVGTNPILNAAVRVLNYEIPGLLDHFCVLNFIGLAVGRNKGQPVGIVEVIVPELTEMQLKMFNKNKKEKIEEYFVYHSGTKDHDYTEMLSNMTEVGRYFSSRCLY